MKRLTVLAALAATLLGGCASTIEGMQNDWQSNAAAARRNYLKATGQQTCTVAGVDLKDLPQEECEAAITATKNGTKWVVVNGKVMLDNGSQWFAELWSRFTTKK